MPAGDGATRTLDVDCDRCGRALGEFTVGVDEWWAAVCGPCNEERPDYHPETMTVYVFDVDEEGDDA